MIKKLLAFTCLTLSIGANAAPVTWMFDNVVYEDGSTTAGSFTYDADAGPNGTYTNLNFVTTCGTFCVGTLGDTTLGLAFPSTDQELYADSLDNAGAGDLFYQDFYWLAPLTNAGGTIGVDSIISNPAFEFTEISSGTVSAVPLPAAAWLFGSALLGLGALKRRKA